MKRIVSVLSESTNCFFNKFLKCVYTFVLYKHTNAVFLCGSGIVGAGGGCCCFRWDSANPGFGPDHLLCVLWVRTCKRK